jgi:hypothetical protein
MFGAQNSRNPEIRNHKPLDSEAILTRMVRDHWAPAAANRGRYAWITDDRGRQRPIVMIWGDPSADRRGFRDFLPNVIRPTYRAATGAEPFIIIIMAEHALVDLTAGIHRGLDGVYNHACGFANPEMVLARALEGVALADAVRALLPADEYAAWARPVAYDLARDRGRRPNRRR